MQEWKMRHKTSGLEMRDWKMWHKNAGRENAGKENTTQEILGWKMRHKSVWKANRRFLCNIKWMIVYWQNKNNHVIHIFRTTV